MLAKSLAVIALFSVNTFAHASQLPMPGRDSFGRVANWKAMREGAQAMAKKAAERDEAAKLDSLRGLTVLSGVASFDGETLTLQTADGKTVTISEIKKPHRMGPPVARRKLDNEAITVAGRPGIDGFEVVKLEKGLDVAIPVGEALAEEARGAAAPSETDESEKLKGRLEIIDNRRVVIAQPGDQAGQEIEVRFVTRLRFDHLDGLFVELEGSMEKGVFNASSATPIEETQASAANERVKSKTEIKEHAGKLKSRDGRLYLKLASGEKIQIDKVSSKIDATALVGRSLNATLKFRDGYVKLKKVSGVGDTGKVARTREEKRARQDLLADRHSDEVKAPRSDAAVNTDLQRETLGEAAREIFRASEGSDGSASRCDSIFGGFGLDD